MSRARLAGLSLLWIAFAAYGSFVPLRLRPIGLTEGLRLALEIPIEPAWHIFNGDFFTNVLVFLPIGFFAAGAIAQSGAPVGFRTDRLWTLGLVLLGSAGVSLLIELGQVFVRDRTPSWSDVYAQALGGVAGAGLWMLAGRAALQWAACPFDGTSSREQRALGFLWLYVAGWTLYALLPTLFPLLAHPHLYLWRSQLNLSGLVLAGPVIIAGLSAVPVGAWAALLSARLRAPWARGLLLVAPVGLLMAADRVRQVGLIPSDGHLASSIVGYLCGWLLIRLGRTRARWSPATRRMLILAGLSGTAFVIALQYWAPFDFGVSQQALDQRVRVLYTRAPFHRYYWLPPLVALGEVTTLALLSMGTSVLVALALRSPRPARSWRAPVLVTISAFAVVEWGQLYLPSRRADPTDVLIAIAGALLGSVIVRALDGASAAKGMTT